LNSSDQLSFQADKPPSVDDEPAAPPVPFAPPPAADPA
jgi:hypothetical protein